MKNLPNFDIFQPIWLKLCTESLNVGTQHMHTINSVKPAYHPSSLPPNQPTSLKVENLPYFDIFQPTWLKRGIESLNGGTQHIHTINSVKPAYHPSSLPLKQLISLKVKNGYNLVIFQPICLKLSKGTQNGKTQHMYLIYLHFVGFVILRS